MCNRRSLEPWHIQNPRHIQNTEYIFIQNPSIFTTLVYLEIKPYSEPCRISNMEHFIKSPV